MCGINAILDSQNKLLDKRSVIRFMNAQMLYRGPDEEGEFIDDTIALGMRRLSIIDVDDGHQPLYNEDRSQVLVCNGEIYNYIELRHELQAKGHLFQSGSDCEVILHLYEEFGEECLEKLRGMFAFTLWDHTKQRLFAARDRVGIKPLYYCVHDGVLWLSSELKAIFAASSQSPSLNPTAVWQFLHYGFPIEQKHTVINGIDRLLPGEYIIADEKVTRRKRYWKPQFGQSNVISVSNEQLMANLQDAIAIHLRSDVPVGILLSSGMDSSTIAAFAARASNNYTTICVGYLNQFRSDERHLAKKTAKYLGLPFLDIMLDPNDFSAHFENAVTHCDEPVADPSLASQWAIYEAGRDHGYKVLLSGIGGDELFFGYNLWNAISETWDESSQEETLLDHTQSYYIPNWLLKKLATPLFLEHSKVSDQPLYELKSNIANGLEAMYSILFGDYLLNNGLLLADKLGMGCSVEVRVPFVDHILVESILALPLNRRYAKSETKVLLKQLLADYLPEFVLQRPKRGFNAPTDYLVDLVNRNEEQICNGLLSATWLDKKLIVRLFPKLGTDKTIANRVLRLLLQRAFMVVYDLGLEQITLSLAHIKAVEFLYRILIFERWWHQILEIRRVRNRTRELKLV